MPLSENAKLLAGVALLPLCADLIEDYPFKRELKMKVNALVNQIRSLDDMIMRGADNETVIQQVDIQKALRQWIETNFSEENEEG